MTKKLKILAVVSVLWLLLIFATALDENWNYEYLVLRGS